MRELECLQQLYTLIFFRRPRAANSVVCGGILSNFKLVQAFMHILVTCKNEEDPLKMKDLEFSQHFSHYKSNGDFSKRSRAANSKVLVPIWPNFEFVRDVI